MNIKHFAAASVVALAPFAYSDQAKASASDCWTGNKNQRALDYRPCDVNMYDHPDGGLYYEVTVGREFIRVDLWEDNDGNPTRAEIVTTDLDTGAEREGSYPYSIDEDGDAGIRIGDFRFVFRFPSHPEAGTGNTAMTPQGVSSRTTPVGYRNGSNGLRQGDLSDTPFRF